MNQKSKLDVSELGQSRTKIQQIHHLSDILNLVKLYSNYILSEIGQNITIEERVSLLEIQVVELDEDVTGLDEDLSFLFDEQVIQDERLFSLEQTSLQVAVELAEINVNIQGWKRVYLIFRQFN